MVEGGRVPEAPGARPSGPALQIRSLSKSFPGQVALNAAQLTVARGQIHALLGQNGSGKSTLIKVLSGFHKPDPGADVELFGRRVEFTGQHDATGRRIRVMHQDLGLVDTLNITENLALYRGFAHTRWGRIQWSSEHRYAAQLLLRFGLDIDPRRSVSTLSEAEQAIVGLARVMHDWDGDDAVLILDEPTASMSKPEVQRLFAAVRKVAADGAGVLFVSHRLDEVLDLAEWVTILRDGRSVISRAVAGLSEQALVEYIIGRPTQDLYTKPPDVFGEQVFEARRIWGSVVENFSLRVRAGEIIGIAGVVGSGRDEVAALLAGSTRRAAGSLTINSTPVPHEPWRSQRVGLAYAPADRFVLGSIQSQSVAANITVSDLVSLTKFGWLTSRAIDREARAWIRIVDLHPGDPTLPLRALSGGNQQKAVMARILRMKPRVIVVDEPTQGVDVGAKSTIYKLLDRAVEDGAAVVLCSSDTQELANVCDRVIVMRNGRIGAELQGADITEDRILELSLRGTG